jgi:glucokinase
MGACVADAVEDAGGVVELGGIGVAMKGFVDTTTGITISSGFLGMKNVPVGPCLSGRFGLAVEVANDVQAATIGEMCFGAGREFSDFIYLNVGTGIAIGIVVGRRLYRGAANLSGEFGHITVDRDGDPCPCGRRGCLEHEVSGPGIVRRARAAAGHWPRSRLAEAVASTEINATSVFTLAEAGDEAAASVMRESAEYLGDGIVNLVNVLNPQAIILGGGVFHEAHGFVRLLQEHVYARGIAEAVKSLELFEMSRLDVDRAGLIGAAALVFQCGDAAYVQAPTGCPGESGARGRKE